jgi:hypothetical protein
MKKGKKINFQIITKPNAAWSVLDKALDWHDDLHDARIGLAWRKALKPDVDGHIVLGRCVKVSDLHKEFFNFDFIIVLNREYWDEFEDDKRLALMDHELSHAAATMDDLTGEQKEDERGHPVWRSRKHDLEEFRDVVKRHGLYKDDLIKFAEAIRNAKKAPLFEKVEAGNKEARREAHGN